MKLTNGMDRAQFHDKAWALYQAKALDDAKLPKMSIYAIRTLWDTLYDSMPANERATPADQEPIYLISPALHSGHWIETDAEHYNDYTDDYRRIVYAAPQSTVEITEKDRESLIKWIGACPFSCEGFSEVDRLHALLQTARATAPQPPQNAADHIEAQSVRDAVIEECVAAIRKAEFSKQDDECMTGMEAVSVIRALKSEPPQVSVRDAWISVDERLPNERENVLVFRPDAHHLPACDPNIDVRNYFGNGVFNGIHKVTHWQPLPAPPQKPVTDEVKP